MPVDFPLGSLNGLYKNLYQDLTEDLILGSEKAKELRAGRELKKQFNKDLEELIYGNTEEISK